MDHESIKAAADPTVEAALAALREVYDPCCEERGISIVDMGLVDAVHVSAASARIELVLTSGWCPFAVRMLDEVDKAIRRVPGIDRVEVEVTWDKAWDTSRMAPEALRKLRLLPDPVDVADRDAYRAQIAATRRSIPIRLIAATSRVSERS